MRWYIEEKQRNGKWRRNVRTSYATREAAEAMVEQLNEYGGCATLRVVGE
jgi:hypothetical protein